MVAMPDHLEMMERDQIILTKEKTYTARGAAMVKTARREKIESDKTAVFIMLNLRRSDVKLISKLCEVVVVK